MCLKLSVRIRKKGQRFGKMEEGFIIIIIIIIFTFKNFNHDSVGQRPGLVWLGGSHPGLTGGCKS